MTSPSKGTPVLGFGAAAGDVSVDLDTFIGSRLLIQGVSGSGKSTMLRGILEQTHGQVQQIVIDREGEFASLRERFDYVLAGRDADVPADPKIAKLLCRRSMKLGVSLVVDLSELRLNEQRLWVQNFFDELVHLPRELWHPVLVALDEAHLFAPERGSGDSTATDAVISVATLGRKRGYCLIAATQRLSKLHKDCAAECLNKLIGYTDDVDLARAGEQLGMTKEQRAGLKQLDSGQFYAYGPAISRQPLLVTGPKTTTKPPPRGGVRAPAPPAPAAIKKLMAQLADLPKQAADEARSVEDLKRDNRELTARIRKLEKGAPKAPAPAPVVKIETKIERVEVPVLKDTQLTRIEKLSDRLVTAGGSLVEFGQELTAAMRQAAAPNGRPHPARPARPAPAAIVRSPSRMQQAAPPASRPAGDAARDFAVSGSQQRILNALAFMASIDSNHLDKRQLALLAGVPATSGGYRNNLSELRTSGLIDYPIPGFVTLTELGVREAEPGTTPRTTEELQAALFERLSASQVRIMEALIRVYPDHLAKDDLAAMVDVPSTSGGYRNNLSELRTAGLIDYPTTGQVVALPILFLEDR